MSLVDSNTFVEPTAGTSLNAARTQFNSSMRSLLTNFKSSAPPATLNFRASGANIDVPEGTLFYLSNANVNTIVIQDVDNKKEAKFTQNFTRSGLGIRLENGIEALTSNVTHYEIGELAATVSGSGTILDANARLYLNIANNDTMADFIDVGIPPTNGSVVNTMIAINGITHDRLNFAFDTVTSSPNNRTNAHLKLDSVTAASNVSILFDSLDQVSNVSLVKHSQSAMTNEFSGKPWMDGLSVFAQNDKFANFAAHTISQLAISNADAQAIGSQFVAPLVPVGTIMLWATGTAPSGWHICDGTELSRTHYSHLFDLIQETYGAGDGSTTFALPDLTNRTAVGAGAQAVATKSTAALGSTGELNTASGFAGIVDAKITVSISAKDAGGTTVVNDVQSSGHTHTLAVPQVRLNYIIKT